MRRKPNVSARHAQLQVLRYRLRPVVVYSIAAIIGLLVGLSLPLIFWREPELLSPVPSTLNYLEVPQVYAAEPTPNDVKKPKAQHIYTGYVSYYSVSGCLGCSKNLTMGNGQKFNENAMTLAVPCEKIKSKELKYNTTVVVTNTINGKSIKAKITDCGGFSKYNRVADLSKGLFNALDAKTDKTIITLEVL